MKDLEALVKAISAGKRRPLAQAITLIESELYQEKAEARKLLALLPAPNKPALRLGVSGPAGVGKSTFIELLGTKILSQNAQAQVAVLAIDPSSPKRGGSILADKTRMLRLARNPRSFIRPSPSRGVYGGVSRASREVLFLLERAGFDHIIVETVGVGQSECLVASMVDLMLLLHMPHTGDSLQSMKKGLIELADMMLVHKADGVLREAAKNLYSDLKQQFFLEENKRDSAIQRIFLLSSLENQAINEDQGINLVLKNIYQFLAEQKKTTYFEKRRQEQELEWFQQELSSYLEEAIALHDKLSQNKTKWQEKIKKGECLAVDAASSFLKEVFATL